MRWNFALRDTARKLSQYCARDAGTENLDNTAGLLRSLP